MSLSRRSRRGAFWVLLLGLLIALTPRMLIFASGSHEKVKITHEDLIVVQEELLQAEEERKQERNQKHEKHYSIPASSFDPNQYTVQDWVKLGLSEKQADVIVRFSERGLYSNDDLKRIFVLPEALYELIKDSTFYPVRENSEKYTPAPKEQVFLDLNTATAEDFEKIPGIGKYFASKMVSYRDQLGGYISREQLLEIRKFDTQKLEAIDRYIYLKAVPVRQMNINEVDFETLRSHPYITYEVANSIVKMREQKEYRELDDIRRSKLIDDELFRKLEPYLTIQ